MTDQELFSREAEFAEELCWIELEIKNRENRKFELTQLLNKCDSKRWIQANKVTLDDIQISSKSVANSIARKVPDNMPFFMDVHSFGQWMRENDIQTRYFEWNNRIYYRLEFFVTNRLPSNQWAHIKDVPGYVEI